MAERDAKAAQFLTAIDIVSGDDFGKNARRKRCGQSFRLEASVNTVNSVRRNTDTSG